ncbi:unnamed protein product [Diamesa tonsa]
MFVRILSIFILTTVVVALKDEVQLQPDIVNGVDASIAEFPYLVSLQKQEYHQCAGSMLNEYWVLTAGHCLNNSLASEFTIEYATTVVSDGFNGTNIVEAERLIVHENYWRSNFENDIGLIKLKTPIRTGLFDSFVKLAPQGNYWRTGTPTTVVGWGRIGSGLPISETLQKVDLQIYTYADCSAAIGQNIYSTNICAGVPEMGKAECNGDSGGPLLVNGVQVGVVSWSIKPCAVAPYPGVYTDVSKYIDWIQEHSGIDFQLNMFLTRQH